jgi:hypothetical protein
MIKFPGNMFKQLEIDRVTRGGGGSTCQRLNLPDGGAFCWWFGSTARGSLFGGNVCSSPSPACPMVWKRLLALSLRGGHSFGVQSPVWREWRRWYDGVGRCVASGSGSYNWLVTMRTMDVIAFWKYGVRFFWQNAETILYFPLFFGVICNRFRQWIPSVII